MTKHPDEFLQFTEPVTCCEYTLPRDEESTNPEGFEGTPKLNPCWKSQPVGYLQGKYGVGIGNELQTDNSHSRFRISHGLNKLVTDLIDKEYDDDEQENSETKTELFALKTEVFVYASRSKDKAKPSRPTSTCSSTRAVPIPWKNMDWYWTRSSIWSSVPSRKKTEHSSSARRNASRRRWCDRILETERWSSEQSWALSIFVWWNVEEQDDRRREATRKDFNIVLIHQDKKFFTHPTLQGHSGGNPIEPTHQDNVLISNNFFEYIYHIGCAVSLDKIQAGKDTVFFTAVNQDDRVPQELDLTKPRLASYKQKWKRHHWVDIQLAQRKGLKFYQTRCNAIIFYGTLPSLLYLESSCDEI